MGTDMTTPSHSPGPSTTCGNAKPRLLCGDWVIQGTKSLATTLASDRGWFATYTPIKSTVMRRRVGSLLNVIGFGTVLLPVKFKDARKRSSKASRRILELHNVLHVPSLPCNFISEAIWDMFPFLPDGANVMKDIEGHNGPMVDRAKPLICLKLSGPPYGPESASGDLEPGKKHVMDYTWEIDDQVLWAKEQVRRRPGAPPINQLTDDPFKSFEEEWVRVNFGSERELISWFDGEAQNSMDRAMGRAIARVLMKGRVDLLVREVDDKPWKEVVREYAEEWQVEVEEGLMVEPTDVWVARLREQNLAGESGNVEEKDDDVGVGELGKSSEDSEEKDDGAKAGGETDDSGEERNDGGGKDSDEERDTGVQKTDGEVGDGEANDTPKGGGPSAP